MLHPLSVLPADAPFKSVIFQFYSKPDHRMKYHKDKAESETFISADFQCYGLEQSNRKL